MPIYAIIIIVLLVFIASEALAIWILARDVDFYRGMYNKEVEITEGWLNRVRELEKEIETLKRG